MRRLVALLALALTATPLAAASKVSPFVIDDPLYHRQRRVWIYEPAEYAASTTAKFPLLILLDGAAYLEDLDVQKVLDERIAAKAIPPLVAVLVDNSEARLDDLANRERFATFVATQLVPWVRAHERVSAGADDIAIGGFSAGGLAAAYVAYRHPDIVHRVLSQSGAFWRGNEGASTPPEWLTEQFRTSPKLPLRFSLEVGAEETARVANGVVFLDANRRLRDVLRAKGYRVDYVEVPGAQHGEAQWKAALGAALGRLFAE